MVSKMFQYVTVLAAFVLLTSAFAACTLTEDDDDIDDEELRPITATPTAVVGLPEDIEELNVAIQDGEFDTDSIDVVAEVPVILYVTNGDDEAYTFMVDDLIQETEIAANAVTTIEFNAPNEGSYEGDITNADGEEVDAFFVNVEGAGGF